MRRCLPALLLLALFGCGEDAPKRGERADPLPGGLQFQGEPPTHLIFLSIDTLRRDHLGVHGAPADHSPFLDRIASEGVHLADLRQCSGWTLPGTSCVLGGRTNLESGWAPDLAAASEESPVEPAPGRRLAHWLGEAGFWSALVSSNLWLSPVAGNGSGYDEYVHPGGLAPAVRETGLGLLEGAAPNTRRFLHLHHMEPHYPYTPDPERVLGLDELEPWPDDLLDPVAMEFWRSRYGVLSAEEQALLKAYVDRIYDGEVRTLDAELELTWAALEAGGWLDDTLVVIWSDHGEQLWDHGWKGHAFSLFADENDATAIFWAKNLEPGVIAAPTGAIDLAPTVLDALGVPIPDEVTGSLVGAVDPERPWFAEILAYGGVQQSVTVGRDKLVYSWALGEVRRYDRDADPLETVDLYQPGADPLAEELWGLLKPKVEALDGLTERTPTWPPQLP